MKKGVPPLQWHCQIFLHVEHIFFTTMSTNDFTTADNIVKSLLNQSAVIIADEQLLPREAEFFNAFRAQLANGEAFIPAGSENPSEKPRYYFHDKFKKKFSNLCQMVICSFLRSFHDLKS